MQFQTTKEQEALRMKVRRFAETEIKPFTFTMDRDSTFPVDAVKRMAQLELMGIPYPKEYGGAGLDILSYAIAVEELSRVDGGTGVTLSAHVSLGSYPIYAYGTEEQKRKYLTPLAKGEKLAAFGLTEYNAGSDAGGTETTAVRDGDSYLLNGGKIFITNADIAEVYIIFAVTTPGIGTRGISAFIVEKGWDGFTFGTHYDKMGIRSSATAELLFKNVRVPAENLLGKEGEGFKIAMSTLDGGRIGIAAQALGIAQGAFEEALDYAKEREQFGAPIAANQGISFKLADMATKLRAARFLVYSAAELKEAHAPYGMEAAMAKMYASDIALEVVNDAMQVFGGNGFMRGMSVERAYRDAKITTIYEGTNEIQRVVIAAHLLGKLKKKTAAGTAAGDAKRAGAPVQNQSSPGGQSKAANPAQPVRKQKIFGDGSLKERVDHLLESLKEENIDFSLRAPLDTPIPQADRVVSAGQGVGKQENMKLIEALAEQLGAAVGASRPVAEMHKYVGMDRFVGISGQKFKGSLYVACGISGAMQHLKGITEAGLIVAINNDPEAPIFQSADYGVVGNLEDVIPLILEALK